MRSDGEKDLVYFTNEEISKNWNQANCVIALIYWEIAIFIANHMQINTKNEQIAFYNFVDQYSK